jgi:hypothetical protein
MRASLIWSAILSGCPSLTDSEVNKYPIQTFYKIKKEGLLSEWPSLVYLSEMKTENITLLW